MKEKRGPNKCYQVKFPTLCLSPSIHHCNYIKLLDDSEKDFYDTYHTMNELFVHACAHTHTHTRTHIYIYCHNLMILNECVNYLENKAKYKRINTVSMCIR